MTEKLTQLRSALEGNDLSLALAALKDAAALGHISQKKHQELYSLIVREKFKKAIELIDKLDPPLDFPIAPPVGVHFGGTAA